MGVGAGSPASDNPRDVEMARTNHNRTTRDTAGNDGCVVPLGPALWGALRPASATERPVRLAVVARQIAWAAVTPSVDSGAP